jgi:hypothetical protein
LPARADARTRLVRDAPLRPGGADPRRGHGRTPARPGPGLPPAPAPSPLAPAALSWAGGAVRPETPLQPSPEQQALIDARRADPAGSLRVLAFASSGKTTVLRLLAGADPSPALYLAYNKSAQTEGRITRLKLLKRQMYGGAGLDLLRRRMLLAA